MSLLLTLLAAAFCGAGSGVSCYLYYINCDIEVKRFPIHFGISGEPDNWSENRHAMKLFPIISVLCSISTVVFVAMMPFWPGLGFFLCMGSAILILCVTQYYAVHIALGTMTRIPPLQFYGCLGLILVTTILCVILCLIPGAYKDSSSTIQ